MKRNVLVGCVVVGSLLSLVPRGAQAQDREKDSDAERLFREGQKLMEERRFGEACPKFDAAWHKDQQLGTLLNLAYCHKEQGAIWQAWLEFKEAELKAIELKRIDRRDFARQRMAELERSLARVIIDPSTKVELVEVLVEDRRIPDGEKGASFAAEPGQRKFTFRAKGKKQVVQLVSVAKGERLQHVNVPEMEDQPKEPVVEAPPPPVVPPPAPPLMRAPPEEPVEGGGWSTQKTVGVVVVGVGVVGIGVGGVFGAMTMFGNGCVDEKKLEGCPANVRQDLSDKGMVSTIGFVAGGAALATGLVLWLTAPGSKRSTASGSNHVSVLPEIGAGWAGLRGVF